MALLFFPLIIVLGYFLLVRPQQNQARQQRAMLGALAIGAEVQTAGGVVGRVVDLDDRYVQLQVGPGTTITFVRSAVAKILTSAPDLDLSDSGLGDGPVPDLTDLSGGDPPRPAAGQEPEEGPLAS